jgi:hypothetical protein
MGVLISHSALDAAHVKLCRYLASLMRKKLPLELRNMIYTYACVEEQPLWFKRVDRVEPGRIAAMRRACDEGLPSENISQTCGYCPFEEYDAERYYANHCEKNVDALDEWEELHTRTILDPRYVGKRIALEAVEVYYNRNTFCVEYDQLLWGFLQENMMGLPGITPADHVRSLHVVMRCEPLQLTKSQGHDQEDEREFLGLLLSRQWRCLEFFRERGRVEGNHVSLLPEDQLRMNNADEHRSPRLQIYFLVRTQFRILGDATTSASRLEAQRTCYNIAEALWPLMLDWSSAADLQGIFHENSNWEGMDNRGYHTAEKLRPLVTRAMLEHRSRVDEFEKAFENDNEHIGNFRWGKKFISSDVAHGELKKEGLEMLIAGDWGIDAFDITYRLAWYGSW